jgi:hypothetical protein
MFDKISPQTYNYDISLKPLGVLNPYTDGRFITSNKTALMARRTYASLIGRNDFNVTNMIRKDREVALAKSVDSLIFLRNYKLGFSEYKKKNFSKSQKYINAALGYRPNDLLCQYLLENCKRRSNRLSSPPRPINKKCKGD